MNMPFLVFLNIILIIVELSVFLILANGFFEKKRSMTFLALSFLIYCLLGVLNVVFFETNTLLRVSVYVVISAVWMVLCYKTSVIKSILVSVLATSLCACLDAALATLPFLIYGDSANLVYNDPAAYYILCYAAKLSEVFVAIVIHAWSRHRLRSQFSSWADWLRVLFFPFCSLALSLYLATILFQEPQLSDEILYCNLLLLVCNFFSIALLNYLERKNQENMRHAMLLQNLKLESDHMASWKETYSNQRKQTHDFHNHLAVLRSLAEREASQSEFTDYLDSILRADADTLADIGTRRTVADIVISQRLTAAHKRRITFRYQLDDLSGYPLPDDELVVILSNLLDNAIEACEKIAEPEKRNILLKMQIRPEAAYLYLENTTAQPVKIRGNRIASTKENPRAHGYGLPNVLAILDRHRADYAMEYRTSDGVFCFSAILSIPGDPV